MPYRPNAFHRPVVITLTTALSLLAGLALGACAGSPGGTAPTSSAARTATTTSPAGSPSSLDALPKIPRDDLIKAFAYATVPLDVKVTATRQDNGLTIQSITFAGRITAEIVSPTAKHGKLPAVVYAHGGQQHDPESFLADAEAFATHGGIALMTDIGMIMDGNPKTDTQTVIDTITADRRALDVLVARKDVDPHRLGFVGHSWGADQAAIMAGVEPRLTAVAIVCGWSRMSTDMADMTQSAAAYVQATSLLDGFRYVAIPGNRKILIQYGRQDPNIPDAQRDELTSSATGTVARKDYDAGHDLVTFALAAADRQSFLADAL